MKKAVFFLLLVMLAIGCRQDSGEFIFEMSFPDIRFEVPAGLSTFNSYVYELEMDSNIDLYLSSNAADTAAITAINPVFARITALDTGVDFEYIQEMSIRICPVGDEPCTSIDEVFYIDSFNPLSGGRIDFLPSLRNARRDLLEDRFKLEVVFVRFNYITPYSVLNSLELRFDAVQ